MGRSKTFFKVPDWLVPGIRVCSLTDMRRKGNLAEIGDGVLTLEDGASVPMDEAVFIPNGLFRLDGTVDPAFVRLLVSRPLEFTIPSFKGACDICGADVETADPAAGPDNASSDPDSLLCGRCRTRSRGGDVDDVMGLAARMAVALGCGRRHLSKTAVEGRLLPAIDRSGKAYEAAKSLGIDFTTAGLMADVALLTELAGGKPADENDPAILFKAVRPWLDEPARHFNPFKEKNDEQAP